jgi:hypothetical protein
MRKKEKERKGRIEKFFPLCRATPATFLRIFFLFSVLQQARAYRMVFIFRGTRCSFLHLVVTTKSDLKSLAHVAIAE